MKKSIALILFGIALALCSNAWADDFEDFSQQLTYFYLHPARASFEKFQKDANRFQSQLENNENGADILVAVMIAKIAQTRKWPVVDGHFGKIAKEILARKTRLAKYIWDDSRVDPGKLDVWWVSYFATGDTSYLEKIFRYAGFPLPKHDAQRMLVIGAASWSFKSNCKQHKSVLEFAKRKLHSASVSDERRKVIKQWIAYAESGPDKQAAAAHSTAPAASENSPSVWHDEQGRPVPDTDSMKSIHGFGGSLVLTTDKDWRKKWNTPPEVRPQFTTASTIPFGKRLFILVFFANPKRDGSGKSDVLCDFRVTKPTGKIALQQKDVTCFQGRLAGDQYNTHLSAPVIAFSGDPGDPAGKWTVEVTLRDVIQNVKLPLRASFVLKR